MNVKTSWVSFTGGGGIRGFSSSSSYSTTGSGVGTSTTSTTGASVGAGVAGGGAVFSTFLSSFSFLSSLDDSIKEDIDFISLAVFLWSIRV